MLNNNNAIKNNKDRYRILMVHSTFSKEEQVKIFSRPPPGVRKIVLSTNISETSITIEDITVVIDSCKLKERQYNPSSRLSVLVETWVSQASAKQRRGRAGRVRDGICFHMITREFMSKLKPYQIPEILRVPLDELCLQIKILQFGSIDSILAMAIETPDDEAIDSSITSLNELGALTKDEKLTILGSHLARLPVDAGIGKMMLFASIFGCLDPILTICSSISDKSPFVNLMDKLEQIEKVKRELAGFSESDHITLLRAFDGWIKAKEENKSKQYCHQYYLSENTMQNILSIKKQLLNSLTDIGFVTENNIENKKKIKIMSN